ncbi:MAG: helicase-related protein, partial [Candidatus Thiodiazotropha sp.]
MSKTHREALVSRFKTDLMGPRDPAELLDAPPTDTYLTGIIWPRETEYSGRDDESDKAEAVNLASDADDDSEVPLHGQKKPSTMGLSFASRSSDGAVLVDIEFNCGTYKAEENGQSDGGAEGSHARKSIRWRRSNVCIPIGSVRIERDGYSRIPLTHRDLPEGVSLYVRSKCRDEMVLMTVILINDSEPPPDSGRVGFEQSCLFQTRLVVTPNAGTSFVPKPHAMSMEDDEAAANDLLYRNCREFAVGHTCSATWVELPSHCAGSVLTEWFPEQDVIAISAVGGPEFRRAAQLFGGKGLSAMSLAEADDQELRSALSCLLECYESWIGSMDKVIHKLPLERHQSQARKHLVICSEVLDRLRHGVDRICDDGGLLEAFRMANKAIAVQNAWLKRKNVTSFSWRPFQLAFLLLAGPSSCDGTEPDRQVMDLLWFPTGGGKTEAYLGLIAMTAWYRRSVKERLGTVAVMRYTLRLLSTQQFERAAALILACEYVWKTEANGVQGEEGDCFSIGLWVGGDATPNTFKVAKERLTGDSHGSPRQLTNCPCCGNPLSWIADDYNQSIECRCLSKTCELASVLGIRLPVWTVDSDVYRERPSLLIGTVDKFAQLPRKSQISDLFSFRSTEAPDLIIQDELHLISGPLGTVSGMYEIAFDWLLTKDGIGPKIVGSTATIRRAESQVRALFDRLVCQFPAPGIDYDDSGFGVRDPDAPGRKYVGVSTAGRSAKFTLQAVSAALLQNSIAASHQAVDHDSYATMLCYFNSLRELGGALVLMQDDVPDSIGNIAKARGEKPRQVNMIQELTSRRSQDEIRGMLDQLKIQYGDPASIDVLLATNMISVGVDVSRLALMCVNGQPKTRAEYIQATSRVGRDVVPGLVVAVLNNAKPRDKAHYETFRTWHQSLYREVEATGVTPFAPRARDRALHAAVVAMVRHGVSGMLDKPDIANANRGVLEEIISFITERAQTIDPG